MRTSERHHLKENDFALALGQANLWAARHRRSAVMVIAALLVLAVAAAGFVVWRRSVDNSARGKLAEAMVVYEARVVPPGPPPETLSAPAGAAPTPAQPPGTYPTERAKLDAALPVLLEAANAHPSTDAGLTARYHAASVLVTLGRFDEAVVEYQRVADEASGLLGQTARLGRAEAEMSGGKYDAAIAGFKTLSERTDLDVPKEGLLLELARAYRMAGKSDEARKTLTQIVEQHAASPAATAAKQELEKIPG